MTVQSTCTQNNMWIRHHELDPLPDAFDVLDFAPAPAGDLTLFLKKKNLVQPDLQTRVHCDLGKGCTASGCQTFCFSFAFALACLT